MQRYKIFLRFASFLVKKFESFVFFSSTGKRIRSDALQAFLKVLTFAYSFFYLIMQYELQCSKFPQ